MKSPIQSKVIVLVFLCLGTAIFLWPLLGLGRDYAPYLRVPLTKVDDINAETVSNPPILVDAARDIPNTTHYVYILANLSSDLSFTFSEVLSIYATSRYWQPDAIYLHTNAPSYILERAYSGAAGKWTQLLFQVPNLHIVEAEAPTYANNGKEITLIEHKSDFVRVAALRQYGGVYLDFDVHPLRDIKPLRESGFHAIVGRQHGDNDEINSGFFMSKPHSKMIQLWSEGIQETFTGAWSAHSNGALTTVCEQLVANPHEVLIMERNAFAPGSWMEDDLVRLLEVHEDEISSLELMTPDGHLPQYAEEPMTRWVMPTMQSAWVQDWSKTYSLHAFNHNQGDFEIRGFKNITPRYVLERRSNLARAVYTVARELYEQGLIHIDDPYKFHSD